MKAHTIVVGYDGSPDAEVALDEAITHAGEDSIVHVVTVHKPRPAANGTEELPEEFEYTIEPDEADRMRLRDAERRLEAAGVHHEAHLPWGRPAKEILDVAETVDADLIVLGSRGLGSVRRLLLGSVSTKVAEHARTSTLIVHHDTTTAA